MGTAITFIHMLRVVWHEIDKVRIGKLDAHVQEGHFIYARLSTQLE
jgi:hypothetical protein